MQGETKSGGLGVLEEYVDFSSLYFFISQMILLVMLARLVVTRVGGRGEVVGGLYSSD